LRSLVRDDQRRHIGYAPSAALTLQSGAPLTAEVSREAKPRPLLGDRGFLVSACIAGAGA